MNVIAINIGNTSINTGYFTNNNTIFFNQKNDNYNFDFLQNLKIDLIKITSVVPNLNNDIIKNISNFTNVFPTFIKREEVPIDTSYYDTSNLGIDRLVSAFFSFSLFEKKHSVAIFDLGTAISISVVNSYANFLGGAILPGVEIGLKSLNLNTALLPDVNIDDIKNQKIIGNNTKSCIVSGAIFGTISIIEGMSKRIEKELGQKCKFVLTGGFSKNIFPILENENFIYKPNLILEGINELANMSKN
ncbi:MAG: type III pantothenate kinase [Defluviitaleaceae bacterium]|nr:type III pantothenate kinase [Defluviitaleaceae bacterium]